MFSLFFAAILAPAAATSQTIFACPVGRKRIAVTLADDRLSYTFGLPGHAEISLGGGPNGGVSYYRQLYARGEDQTLRFDNGAWSYVVFQRWQAPRIWDGGTIDPEIELGGVLVMKDRKIIRRIDCDKGTSDMHEWPIFERLKQDAENRTPDNAGV